MRDVVWTIILVWLVWKIIDTFKSAGKARASAQSNSNNRREGDVKVDYNGNQKQHYNPKDAEYVDYEEVK